MMILPTILALAAPAAASSDAAALSRYSATAETAVRAFESGHRFQVEEELMRLRLLSTDPDLEWIFGESLQSSRLVVELGDAFLAASDADHELAQNGLPPELVKMLEAALVQAADRKRDLPEGVDAAAPLREALAAQNRLVAAMLKYMVSQPGLTGAQLSGFHQTSGILRLLPELCHDDSDAPGWMWGAVSELERGMPARSAVLLADNAELQASMKRLPTAELSSRLYQSTLVLAESARSPASSPVVVGRTAIAAYQSIELGMGATVGAPGLWSDGEKWQLEVVGSAIGQSEKCWLAEDPAELAPGADSASASLLVSWAFAWTSADTYEGSLGRQFAAGSQAAELTLCDLSRRIDLPASVPAGLVLALQTHAEGQHEAAVDHGWRVLRSAHALGPQRRRSGEWWARKIGGMLATVIDTSVETVLPGGLSAKVVRTWSAREGTAWFAGLADDPSWLAGAGPVLRWSPRFTFELGAVGEGPESLAPVGSVWLSAGWEVGNHLAFNGVVTHGQDMLTIGQAPYRAAFTRVLGETRAHIWGDVQGGLAIAAQAGLLQRLITSEQGSTGLAEWVPTAGGRLMLTGIGRSDGLNLFVGGFATPGPGTSPSLSGHGGLSWTFRGRQSG
jgi:hypothetical protein